MLAILSEILVKFLKGLAKSQPGFNSGPVSQAIKAITTALCDRIDVKPARYLALHKEFFLQTKESNSQVGDCGFYKALTPLIVTHLYIDWPNRLYMARPPHLARLNGQSNV